jgi:hypothetical protein
MAEILVSTLCDCRPPLLIGGHFHCPRASGSPLGGGSRAAPSPVFRRPTGRQYSPDFRPFRLLCALFFALFPIVLAPADFLKRAQSLAL